MQQVPGNKNHKFFFHKISLRLSKFGVFGILICKSFFFFQPRISLFNSCTVICSCLYFWGEGAPIDTLMVYSMFQSNPIITVPDYQGEDFRFLSIDESIIEVLIKLDFGKII